MTTDGGGWTALLNPIGMTSTTIPGLSISWAHVGTGSSSCNGAPFSEQHHGWWGWRALDCGNYTNAYTITWANPFGASDVKFVAALQGWNTHTLTIDGVAVAPDASSADGVCHFYNGPGLGTLGAATHTCTEIWHDTTPSVQLDSFTGAMTLIVTVGQGCVGPFGAPNCTYGEGFNVYRMLVR